MPARELHGIWTYRSLINAPLLGDFKDLEVWQAELCIEADDDSPVFYGHLGERPAKATGKDPYLTVKGDFMEGSPPTVRWRAVGKMGTEYEGWVYDYAGILNPGWPDGKNGNRPTIVGTVTRTVQHGKAPAGSVFSFVCVKRDFVEPRVSIPLKQEVLDMVASLEYRLHHQLWHGSRDEWAGLSDGKKAALRDLGWQPGPKNAERLAFGADMYTNGSGEDFFFMHRQMIGQVKAIDAVPAWKRVPRPGPLANFDEGSEASKVGNPDGFALPEPWVVPDDVGTTHWLHDLRRNSTLYGRFQAWEAQYTDPAYLSRVTLGELGARIEWTIHNWMHMRWASIPRDPSTGIAIPDGRADLDFDAKWLQPTYDYLGETFSSHVNPVFWRLHGWVDERIEDWFNAHETAHPGEIQRMELQGVRWFSPGKWVQVSDPWVGPAGHHHAHGSGHAGGVVLDPNTMKQALAVIFGPEPTVDLAMATEIVSQPAPSRRGSWFKNVG